MQRLYRHIPVLLIISAFGPYLFAGLKLDNVVIYPLALLVLFAYLAEKHKPERHSLLLFGAWLYFFCYLLLRTTLSDEAKDMSSMLAEIKNFTQPLAIMMLFVSTGFLKTKENCQKLMVNASKVLVFMLCMNTLWIYVGFYYDTTPINAMFWGGEESVGARALLNGRYGGVFNQPMESGVTYSMGLLAWLYAAGRVRFRNILVLVLLIAGGLVSISKVFLFGGIPMFILGLFMSKMVRKQTAKIFIWFAILAAYPINYLSEHWRGAKYLVKFFRPGDNRSMVDVFTAGRYGGDGQWNQNDLYGGVWQQHPLIGMGIAYNQVKDSEFFHFFGSGGLIGLCMYCLFLLMFIWYFVHYRKHIGPTKEMVFFGFLVILIVIGSFGAPIFTLNRSSVVLWTFIGLLLQYYSLSQKEEKSTIPVPKYLRQRIPT